MLHYLKKKPILFAGTFACFKNCIADYIIQKNTRKKFNIQRNISFSLFGLLHIGIGQYFIFNKIIPNILGCYNYQIINNNVIKAIFLDLFIHVPFIYFPLFYTFKHFGETNKPNLNTIILNYKKNIFNDMIISTLIFMPIQYFNFKYIKPYLRVPILSSTGFAYVMLLSYLRL